MIVGLWSPFGGPWAPISYSSNPWLKALFTPLVEVTQWACSLCIERNSLEEVT